MHNPNRKKKWVIYTAKYIQFYKCCSGNALNRKLAGRLLQKSTNAITYLSQFLTTINRACIMISKQIPPFVFASFQPKILIIQFWWWQIFNWYWFVYLKYLAIFVGVFEPTAYKYYSFPKMFEQFWRMFSGFFYLVCVCFEFFLVVPRI